MRDNGRTPDKVRGEMTNVTSTSNLRMGGGKLGQSYDELPKVMEYANNMSDKKSNMSKSLYAPS